MRAEYITIGDKKYRCANNWHATILFCERKNIEDLSLMGSLSKIKPRDLTIMMRSCLIAGEDLDGREFDLNEKQLAGLCSNKQIGEFVRIFKKQSEDIVLDDSASSKKINATKVTINNYKGYAIGVMGMSVVEFEKMLIGEFFLKLRYFSDNKEKEIRRNEELIRLQTVNLINIQLDRSDKIVDVRDFWLFAWESEEREESLEIIDEGEAVINASIVGRML